MGSVSSKLKSERKLINKMVSWFEIPVFDLQRAVAFYDEIFQIHMETLIQPDYAIAFFPADGGNGGALVMGQGCIPSEAGTLLYLNGGNNLSDILARVEPAGGRVILAKSLINEDAGYFSLFIDTEGNKLALHSKN